MKPKTLQSALLRLPLSSAEVVPRDYLCGPEDHRVPPVGRADRVPADAAVPILGAEGVVRSTELPREQAEPARGLTK
jgi:hypothetical protein